MKVAMFPLRSQYIFLDFIWFSFSSRDCFPVFCVGKSEFGWWPLPTMDVGDLFSPEWSPLGSLRLPQAWELSEMPRCKLGLSGVLIIHDASY